MLMMTMIIIVITITTIIIRRFAECRSPIEAKGKATVHEFKRSMAVT